MDGKSSDRWTHQNNIKLFSKKKKKKKKVLFSSSIYTGSDTIWPRAIFRCRPVIQIINGFDIACRKILLILIINSEPWFIFAR